MGYFSGYHHERLEENAGLRLSIAYCSPLLLVVGLHLPVSQPLGFYSFYETDSISGWQQSCVTTTAFPMNPKDLILQICECKPSFC
jgi:hypothetical protein